MSLVLFDKCQEIIVIEDPQFLSDVVAHPNLKLKATDQENITNNNCDPSREKGPDWNS